MALNPPNGEQPQQDDDARTVDDVTRGLEEVVRLNREQFDAFADIRKDLQELTKRIRSGNLLLLPRSSHAHAPKQKGKR